MSLIHFGDPTPSRVVDLYQSSLNSSSSYFLPPINQVIEFQNLTSLQSKTDKFNEFIIALGQNVSEAASFSKRDITPLKKILNLIIAEENQTIKTALTKEKGYLGRLFSDESWDEWLEHLTALGKVVTVFEDFMENQTPSTNFMRRLNQPIVDKAIKESRLLLKQLKHSKQVVASKEKTTGSCATDLALGAFGSIATQNPIPISIASMSCLESAAATCIEVYQGEVILKPGDTFYIESACRKLALCKNGITAWNSEASCNHHGPALHVTFINRGLILYDGPFHGSKQWNGGESHSILRIVNKSDKERAIYVHFQERCPSDFEEAGCCIM